MYLRKRSSYKTSCLRGLHNRILQQIPAIFRVLINRKKSVLCITYIYIRIIVTEGVTIIKLTHLWARLSNILYLYHIDHSLATIVQLNIYRLTDSQLGFYHTGLEFRNREYTYCFDTGIIYHPPRRCKFAIFLGTVTLGPVLASYDQFWDIMRGNVNNKILKKYSPALKLIKFISLNRLI